MAFLSVTLFFAFAFEKRFELSTLSNQYGLNIVSYQESPYGRIVLTKEEGEYTFWESGTPIPGRWGAGKEAVGKREEGRGSRQ